MTRGRVALLGAAALVALGGAAWLNRIPIILAIAAHSRPSVAPNHAVAWQSGPAAAPAAGRPPNVVVILADDLGWNDISLHGGGIAGGVVKTPHIDAIAQQGVELTQGYAGNATCAPSRAAIMTGRYATRFGFEFTPAPASFARVIALMSPGKPHPTIFRDDLVENMPPLDREAVPPGEITVAKLLQGRGYHTLHFGKWHLGATGGSRPEQMGFDESLGFTPGASLYLPEDDPGVENSHQDFDPIDRFLWAALPYGVQYNGGPWFAPRGYMTDYLTDEAIAAVHENRNRPFLLYFAPNAPHTPLQAKQEDFAALAAIPDHRLRVYGAMVRNLDANIGRLMQALRDDGLDDNTLVIFTSDNGGAHYIGLPDINKPYRGWKATFFEGGMHVPYFLRWPGHIAPGGHFAMPAAHVDIFATAAAAAGAALPADRVMDGVDLLPYVTGAKQGAPHKALFWRSGGYRVVLQDGWKYQRLDAPPERFLFDLNTDPTEQHDLLAAEPARAAALEAVMNGIDAQQARPLWPSLISAPIAIDHPGGEPWRPGDTFIYWDN